MRTWWPWLIRYFWFRVAVSIWLQVSLSENQTWSPDLEGRRFFFPPVSSLNATTTTTTAWAATGEGGPLAAMPFIDDDLLWCPDNDGKMVDLSCLVSASAWHRSPFSFVFVCLRVHFLLRQGYFCRFSWVVLWCFSVFLTTSSLTDQWYIPY